MFILAGKMTAIGAELAIINISDLIKEDCLGKGGFGAVYKCSHVNWGTVAMKQLHGVRLVIVPVEWTKKGTMKWAPSKIRIIS